ncbi:hypothetical protein BH09SUM1_BH09SUM1_21260 [soil metagenome]
MKPRSAFTLIELLVVVAIIAILAAIAVPNFLAAQTRAKVSRAHTDLRTMSLAVEMYRVDHNYYPGSFVLNQLSTPIAYLTNALMPDVFYKTGSPYLGYLQGKGASDQQFLADFQVASTTNERAVLASHGYFIFSNGPDLIDNALDTPQASFNDVVGVAGATLGYFYDPTNGVTSRGDILRTAKLR